MVFLVVMYRCESWTIKNSEHWRIDAFKLWSWRRLFESPLNSQKIKAMTPKGNQPWKFLWRNDAEVLIPWPPDTEPTHWKRPSWWERLRAGGKGWMWWLDGITDSMEMGLSKLWEMVNMGKLTRCRQSGSLTPHLTPSPHVWWTMTGWLCNSWDHP